VVVITGSEGNDLAVCEMLREEMHHERIIAIPGNARLEDRMIGLGVQIVDARRVVASTIENLILRPEAYHSLVETFENFVVEDITIIRESVEGKRVMDIPLHKDAMIMLVARGEEKFVPHGNTYLRMGDILTLFGTGSAIEEIRKIISRN
jgi:Trk K+ transport system NAD-binding subunit